MSVLIVAQPGPLRDALTTLLTVMPQIETVSQTDDPSSALRTVVEHHPALVLLDSDQALSVVRKIKAIGSGSQCLVLADNIQQQREAQTAGADVAVVKGFPAAELYEIIQALLSDREMLQ